MIGKWLCWLGFHRFEYRLVELKTVNGEEIPGDRKAYISTPIRCKRKGCPAGTPGDEQYEG